MAIKKVGRKSEIRLRGRAANQFFAQLFVASEGEKARDKVDPGSPLDVAIQEELQNMKTKRSKED